MEKLLTVKEAADLLHCHPQSVYKNSSIPRITIPGVGVRFNPKDIENLSLNCRSNPILLDDKVCGLNRPYLQKPSPCVIKKSGGLRGMAKANSKTRYNLGYGAIYQRKTNKGRIRWYLDYRDAKGNRIQKVAPLADTREHAEIGLWKELESERGAAFGIPSSLEPKAFEDYAESFKMNYLAVERKNWSTDGYRLGQLIGFFKGKKIDEIDPDSLRRFKKDRIDLGNSERTINRYLALLKKMFNVAISQGLLKENPVKQVKFYSERDTHRSRVLSPEEEVRLMAECSEYHRRIVVVALHSGLRRGEILGLKWKQVDFSRRELVIEHSKGKKVRFIPMNQVLYDALWNMRLENGKGDSVFSSKSIRTAFVNACRRAEIEGLTFHDLRRTFGTRLLERGCDIITIQRLFGHSSPLVTQLYLHPDDRLSREAVRLLVEDPSQKIKMGENVLHPCDMENSKTLNIPPSSSGPIN